MKTILIMTILSCFLVILLLMWFSIMPTVEQRSETTPPPQPAPRKDAWTRIAMMIPGTGSDLEILKGFWSRIDGAFGQELDVDEVAIRRCLDRDLPLIADTLEEAIGTAGGPEEVRAAQAKALESVENTVTIMKAHLANLHKAACDAQSTVGRYLECRVEDVAPSGPFVPVDAARDGPTALTDRSLENGAPIPLRFDAERVRVRRNGMEDESIPY